MASFDDGKDSGALRTIGEVAKATGIKPHVLRYWEQQFPIHLVGETELPEHHEQVVF